MSVYVVIMMLFMSMMLFALRRQADADRLAPSLIMLDLVMAVAITWYHLALKSAAGSQGPWISLRS